MRDGMRGGMVESGFGSMRDSMLDAVLDGMLDSGMLNTGKETSSLAEYHTERHNYIGQ